MTGYGAVVSFQQTVERILESSRIELAHPSRDIILLAYRELEPLKEILERLDSISPSKSRKKVNALDQEIKEAVWRFEDVLESHISHQILSQFERDVLLFSIDLQSLRHDFDSFIETVKDMEKKYLHELDNMPELEEDESAVSSSRNDFGGMKAKMVGFFDLFVEAKNQITHIWEGNCVCALVGMPGSGKTTFAEKVYEDPDVLRWFDHRVWVTVGRKYELNEIERRILAQVDPDINEIPQGDDRVCKKLKERLESKKCLIVLDNIWDTEVLDYFIGENWNYTNNGVIRILLTTNLQNVANICKVLCGTYPMQPLNEKESEALLRETVFGEDEEDFPPHLEKAAKKIAKNCKGLPLMIVTVADLLSKANNNDDPEFWNEVAENRNSVVMMDAHNQISKVLFPVYDCSPQCLKTFYLYMGAFPRDCDIPTSKLITMFTAEGLLELRTLNEILQGKVNEFGRMNNVVISKEKSVDYQAVKTCCLNSFWHHLFNKEASKDKFLLVLNSSVVDSLEENMKGQRRLSLHSNFVFSFKEVYDSVQCDCASTARSLLCFGPYHQYSMPLDVGFKLLRVLDALKVRFYNFPNAILKLVLLQYLALTYNGELPPSISKLWNLQFLIIHPHMSIKSCGAPSYVPVQIWDMQQLKHIEILGRNLPNPKHAASLQKLSTLLGVSADSCTRKVLKKLPNIRKLGIQIELTPKSGISNPLSWSDRFVELEKLETLKCSIVNPEVKYGCVALVNPLGMIPSRLQKLHLSGLGYPWKYMEAIGSMPNLRVLKLRCYAFRGPKWETVWGSFLSLEYLLIEDTDLVEWEPGHGSFPKLRKLSIKHCYKLREFHWPGAAHSGMIEIVDCNPLAVNCAEQSKQRHEYYIEVIASFEDEKLLLKKKEEEEEEEEEDEELNDDSQLG